MIAIIKVIRNIVDDVKFIFATIVFKYCVCPPNIIGKSKIVQEASPHLRNVHEEPLSAINLGGL